ncbi:MAG: Crp/Fnr family transcriptional regulator [Bilifractor sp.]|jgi:CRP-like cAMP-binding protein
MQIKKEEITEIYEAHIPLFRGLDSQQIGALAGHLDSHISGFEKGSHIIMEEENVKFIGIVLSGRVDMIREDIRGNKIFITYMRKGELFGETFGIMKQTASKVTFNAAEDTRVLFLSLSRILHPCSRQCTFHVHLADNLYDLLGQKNMQLIEKVEIVSKPDLRSKILSYLTLQAEKQNSRYIEIPLNREEMAEYLCANRSSLSRELALLKRDGILDFHRNTFVLLCNPWEPVSGEPL